VEKEIVMIRQELVEQMKPQYQYSFHGAIAIHQALNQRGFKQLPSIPTINRVLKRQDLITPKPKPKKKKSTVYYPTLATQYPNHRHEMDLVTPRYISGYGKVVAMNRIDAFSNHANLLIFKDKGADSVLEFFTFDWKTFGIPEFLQLDNEAAFRGSLSHARSFGKLSRFCLNFGVQIIFIPWNEPWRNPFIENFNGHFNRVFWQKRRFDDKDHMQKEAQHFLTQYNTYQNYKKDRFSKKQPQSHTTRFLPKHFHLDPDLELPITQGKLHFVRRVEATGKINVLNENFLISKNLVSEYVWITMSTAEQTLTIFHQEAADQKRQIIKELKYQLREPVLDQTPVEKLMKL
jgi:hypothetical protein